jgi:hypothetical protein
MSCANENILPTPYIPRLFHKIAYINNGTSGTGHVLRQRSACGNAISVSDISSIFDFLIVGRQMHIKRMIDVSKNKKTVRPLPDARQYSRIDQIERA